MAHSAQSTRPGTPYYLYEQAEGTAMANQQSEPPPSYSSSSAAPSGSASARGSPSRNTAETAALPRNSISSSSSSSLSSSQRDALSASLLSSLSDTDPFSILEAGSTTTDSGSTGSGSGSSDFDSVSASSTTARSLRFGYIGALGAVPGHSRLSSRAGSPAPLTSIAGGSTGVSANLVPSASTASSTSTSTSSAVHHHIHHHYHHSHSSASSTTSANASASTSASASGSLTGSPAGISGGPSLTAKGKERCSTAEYAIPNDAYFNAGYHYRSGPLARKLGSAILSRDPSLTDLPTYASNGGTMSGYSTPGGDGGGGGGSHRRRSGWRSPRPRKNTDVFDDGSHLSLLDHINGHSSLNSYRYRRRISAVVPPSLAKAWQRFLRHPLVPTQPLTILFSLAAFALFAFSVTSFMYHILSTDKAPRPWRAYCQEQRPFPHELADSLAPVDVFVGVFSVDAAYERRHLIRSTYLRHSRPIDPYTGKPGQNVQLKFILGRPRKHHARRIALEMETYDDIVVLDVKENMNKGKTHAFFRWANENATVPIYYKPPQGKRIGKLGPSSDTTTTLNLGFKKADYVVKADDDSFLVLSELERHLRVAPRKGTYWGYLIRNLFMGGECYALSADLVNYVATYMPLEPYTTGAEDKRVAKWMRMHPNASSINWVTERCYVYDHPKAGTTYSHGFLFPDEVERVRLEGKTGISATEKARRGGEGLADAWSTVTKWKQAYRKPKGEMTMEEEVEALVEGGGRWSALDGWTNKISSEDVVRWDSVVFEAQDERIKGSEDSARRAEQARAEHNARTEMSFGKYNRMPNSLIRDPGDTDIRPQNAKRGLTGSLASLWKRALHPSDADEDDEAFVSPAATNLTGSARAQEGGVVHAHGLQFPIGSSPSFKQGYSFLPDTATPVNPDVLRSKAVPAPSPRYDGPTMSLRERRFLGLPAGGTVVVHYLKRNEWFLETALALLGRERTWDTGLEAPAYRPHVPLPPASAGKQPAEEGETQQLSRVPTWNARNGEIEIMSPQYGGARMYGSPLIRENGFISLGRTVPWDALSKSEERTGGYGKLKGSPRQRYADSPASPSHSSESDENKSSSSYQTPEPPSSSSQQSSSLASAPSSPESTHERPSSSSSLTQSADHPKTAPHTHSASSASSADLQQTDTKTPSSSSEGVTLSSQLSGSALQIQNPAVAALQLA